MSPEAVTSSAGAPTRSATIEWNCWSTHCCGASCAETRTAWATGRKVFISYSQTVTRPGREVLDESGAVPAEIHLLHDLGAVGAQTLLGDAAAESVVAVAPQPAIRACPA